MNTDNVYLPIDTAPAPGKRAVFVVIAINVECGTIREYTSDPYCVFRNSDGSFARWPHKFPPTHWYPLPDPRTCIKSSESPI